MSLLRTRRGRTLLLIVVASTAALLHTALFLASARWRAGWGDGWAGGGWYAHADCGLLRVGWRAPSGGMSRSWFIERTDEPHVQWWVDADRWLAAGQVHWIWIGVPLWLPAAA